MACSYCPEIAGYNVSIHYSIELQKENGVDAPFVARERVVANQVWTRAMVNETTIMQAKAKLIFMTCSDTGVMAFILNRSGANKKFGLVI
ncbi:hypothetical protein EMIT0P218_150014 [Pseudomonas sp. IT-P218]